MKPKKVCKACQPDRRWFLKLGIGSLAASTLASAVSVFKFLTPPVSYEAGQIYEAGDIKDYGEGHVQDIQMGEKKISLIKDDRKLYALVRNCTHMGCIPNYNKTEKAFICPCHGSKFDIRGNVLRGPAPEPLYRASLEVNPEGKIEVNTAVVENHHSLRESEPFTLTT